MAFLLSTTLLLTIPCLRYFWWALLQLTSLESRLSSSQLPARSRFTALLTKHDTVIGQPYHCTTTPTHQEHAFSSLPSPAYRAPTLSCQPTSHPRSCAQSSFRNYEHPLAQVIAWSTQQLPEAASEETNARREAHSKSFPPHLTFRTHRAHGPSIAGWSRAWLPFVYGENLVTTNAPQPLCWHACTSTHWRLDRRCASTWTS